MYTYFVLTIAWFLFKAIFKLNLKKFFELQIVRESMIKSIRKLDQTDVHKK